MGDNSALRMFLYLALFIQCTAAYSFSQSKNTEDDGNIFFTPMLNKERKGSYLKGISQNAHEGYNPRKERHATKIKQNMNKLFQTLYPNEAQMEESKRKEFDYQGSNMESVHDKQEAQVNNRSYDAVGDATYSAMSRESHDEGIHNSRRKGIFLSGNVLNRDLPSIYPVGQRGETTHQNFTNVSNFGGEEKTVQHHSGENMQDQEKAATNDQSTMEILGKSEKLKSESKFAFLDYLKDLFQKSTYVKKFQNFIELFFNKYDQRVLESTIFFNFDETLF